MKRFFLTSIVFFSITGASLQLGGCLGTDDGDDDCQYEPSQCSYTDMSTLCAADVCTTDGHAADCDTTGCSVRPLSRLSIPLSSESLLDGHPDLTIRVNANVGDILVHLDGEQVPVGVDEDGFPHVDWEDVKKVPSTLEISFTAAGDAPVNVSVSFHDTECEVDERLACNGGGA